MMSIITLYAGCKITTTNNFAVDNIEEYLATLSSRVITQANYFKQGVQTQCKLDLTEKALNLGGANYNYCKIQNYDIESNVEVYDEPCYYYITNKTWKSKKVVILDLTIDSYSTIGSKISLTKRTLIHREHIDRYYYKNGKFYAKVDKIPEGINPILRKTNEYKVQGGAVNNNFFMQKWYLVYANQNAISESAYNQVNPVNIFVVPEFGTKIAWGNSDMIDAMEEGKTIILSAIPNGNVSSFEVVDVVGGGETIMTMENRMQTPPTGSAARMVDSLIAKKESGTCSYQIWRFLYDEDGTYISSQQLYFTGWRSFSSLPIRKLGGYIKIRKINSADMIPADRKPFYTPNAGLKSSLDNIVDSINKYDRTDSRIIKIIELPYCPLQLAYYDSSKLYFEQALDYKAFGDLVGLTINELSMIKSTHDKIGNYFSLWSAEKTILFKNPNTMTSWKTIGHNEYYEPKLLHSEFYNTKFIYDSFNYLFAYEAVDVESLETSKFTAATGNNFSFNFVVSTSVASKFGFDFSDFFPLESEEQDYSYFMNVSRNNEVAVYTNQYLNYLRTGLQYDLKSKERQAAMSGFGVGLSVVGAAAGVGLGIASENPAIIAASVISGITSVTSSIVSSVNQSISAQQSIEQKMASLRAQTSSVNGADDLGLLDYYTGGNKAKIAKYSPSNVMRANIERLFHYMGYKREVTGIPNMNSRSRFNFIQADIDIDTTAVDYPSTNVAKGMIEDLKARYAVGLTIIHKFDDKWDFEQYYENFESVLIQYLP